MSIMMRQTGNFSQDNYKITTRYKKLSTHSVCLFLDTPVLSCFNFNSVLILLLVKKFTDFTKLLKNYL